MGLRHSIAAKKSRSPWRAGNHHKGRLERIPVVRQLANGALPLDIDAYNAKLAQLLKGRSNGQGTNITGTTARSS